MSTSHYRAASTPQRRLVLWRHGQTQWNAAKRFQGQTDVPLNDQGRAQATAAAAQLALLRPDVILSSDLQRAQVTAQALSDLVAVPIVTDARLRETHAGSWQGLDRAELLANHGPDLAAWAAGSDLRPGGGERRSEVAQRMVAAIADHWQQVPAGGVMVVATHGGSARAAVGQLLGLPMDYWSILGVLTNCAWTVLTEQGRRAQGAIGEAQTRADSASDVASIAEGAAFAQIIWRLEEYNARSLPEQALADDR